MIGTSVRNQATSVRYEPDENPPGPLTFGCGVQLVVVGITGLVLIPTIVIRAAGGSETYLSWTVFCTVAISGACTALQAVRIGRLGAGYVLWAGPGAAVIGISVTALVEGGPALLAFLVIVSSLLPLLISARLSVFRRLVTPTLVGTVHMLIAATVLPVVVGRLNEVPDGVPALGAPLTAAATMLVICTISLRGTAKLRLWAPPIGVVAGSAVAGAFGLYDLDRVVAAPWFGLPPVEWPGIDSEFGPAFVGLLPAFLFAALIGAVQTVTSAVAIQRVSWRRPRAVDSRAVEGAVAADGVAKLLAGIAGIMPIQTTAVSIPTVDITGVGARRVGIAAGAVMLCLALLPKALALLLAIPGPVAAACITVLLALIFMRGMTEVVHGGIDHRNLLIAGGAFWVGVGCHAGVIFPEQLSIFAGGLLQNGITVGGLVAVLMNLFLEATAPRPSRLVVKLDATGLSRLREFIGEFASRGGWDEKMARRLEAASGESLLALLDRDDGRAKRERRRLFLSARKDVGGAVLEFVGARGEENIQDWIGLLAERPDDVLVQQKVSLRLLRHIASSVLHQQFNDTDIVTVRVDARGPPPPAFGAPWA